MSSPHPLDPASAQEYLAGRDILVAAGLLAEPVRFAYYGLEEAAKDEVLAGATGDRRLRAFLVNLDSGESTDAVVSLTDGKVVSARTLDPARDGQMPILESDFARVDEITKADPGWRAAMARRGYHDVSKIRTAPITAGAYGPAEDDRRRMVRVLAFVQEHEHDLAWAHPVDGVAAYVDLIEKKVFKVTDDFELPVPPESGDYDDEAVRGPHRTTLKPIEITQPEGSGFTLDGYALRWQDWSMRVGFDAREGLTLHQVSLAGRPVLYRASIPEMVVPYGDPKFRHWQAYFDTGEYLVGKFANSLELGCDRANRLAFCHCARDLLPLSQRQRDRATAPARWSNAAGLSQNASNRGMSAIEQMRNLVQRPAFLPSLPHQGLLAVRVVGACAVLHLQHSCCLRSDQCVASTS